MYNDVDELRQYSHPNRKDLEALRTHTALMILPGCAFFRSSVETCTYVAFRIGVQILNRDKSIDAGSTASAWRAMVRYRVLNFEFRIPSSQKDSMLIEVGLEGHLRLNCANKVSSMTNTIMTAISMVSKL